VSAIATTTRCASCDQPMQSRTLARTSGGDLQIDLCHPCHAIWFDRNESLQLAPRAVIELFRDIHRHRDDARRPLAETSKCPHCRTALVLTRDVGKAGRFTYYRCPQDHGRLTPFSEFLREKQFVRALSPAELARVRAELKTVRCSGCGAAVDLERESKCGFCRAPIAILDPDAVERAVKMWSEAEARRVRPTREKLAEALLDMQAVESKARRDAKRWSVDEAIDTADLGGDLLQGAIEILGDVLGSIDF
jgi:Zn-finger nucleic acid-binding protein